MDERIVTGASGVLSMVFYDSNDVGTYATGGVVVRVTRDGDGAYLTAGTGYSTAASATDVSGHYTITIGPQTYIGTLTCEWVATTASGQTTTITTNAEIVGSRLCNVADVRNSDPTLADATKYPSVKVWAAIRETEDEFERILGCGVISRSTVETLWGGGIVLVAHHRPVQGVYSLTTGTSSVPASGLNVSWIGEIGRKDGYAFQDLSGLPYSPANSFIQQPGQLGTGTTVWYVYGLGVVPADLKRAALTRIRYRLNLEHSGMPDRAMMMTAPDGGTFEVAVPSVKANPNHTTLTGMPEVDAVLARYSMLAPGVA